MLRIEDTPDASLAAILARIKFGIAMAAMMRMIATTINSSISEKPFCFLMNAFLSRASLVGGGVGSRVLARDT
jgi:hypothetical protein